MQRMRAALELSLPEAPHQYAVQHTSVTRTVYDSREAAATATRVAFPQLAFRVRAFHNLAYSARESRTSSFSVCIVVFIIFLRVVIQCVVVLVFLPILVLLITRISS